MDATFTSNSLLSWNMKDFLDTHLRKNCNINVITWKIKVSTRNLHITQYFACFNDFFSIKKNSQTLTLMVFRFVFAKFYPIISDVSVCISFICLLINKFLIHLNAQHVRKTIFLSLDLHMKYFCFIWGKMNRTVGNETLHWHIV